MSKSPSFYKKNNHSVEWDTDIFQQELYYWNFWGWSWEDIFKSLGKCYLEGSTIKILFCSILNYSMFYPTLSLTMLT